jgi:hypothetical protein
LVVRRDSAAFFSFEETDAYPLSVINICKTLASVPGPTLSLSLAALGGMRWSFVITGGLKLVCAFLGSL